MKKGLLLIVFFTSTIIFAQHKDYKKTIDSIYQKKWEQSSIDLDSVFNPNIINVTSLKKDSIRINKDVVNIISRNDSEPLTPSAIIKLPNIKKWFLFGQNSLVFNQSSFSNWYSGGNDNIGVLGKINYNLVYKKERHYLDNNFQFGYGFVSSTGQSTRKTDDYIKIESNYGYELTKDYYFSTGFQFVSQFTAGYNYAETPDPTYNDRISEFMAPGYFNLGAGFSYNPKDNFQLIFRPLNGKFTFVLDKKLQKTGNYGLEYDGQSVRTELGAMLNLLYKFKIYEDINYVNQINLFTNYLQHTERVDISYSGTLNIKFNKYLTTIVTFDMTYDHDQVQKLQRKQTLGVGLTYSLGYKMEREKKNGIIKPFVN